MGAFAPAAVSAPAGIGTSAFTPGLDMKDILLQMFKSRQGGFGAGGFNLQGTGLDIPGQGSAVDAGILPGGGLAWGSIDPFWWQPPPPPPQRMVDVVAETVRKNRKWGGDPEVAARPLMDPTHVDLRQGRQDQRQGIREGFRRRFGLDRDQDPRWDPEFTR